MKLQAEIDEAFAENDGKLPDYNTILSLPYLDMVIQVPGLDLTMIIWG